MSTTPEPTIVHPTWCDPAHCDEDRTGGYLRTVSHASAPLGRTLGVFDGFALEMYLTSANSYDGVEPDYPTRVYIQSELGSADELTVDALEDLGRWLLKSAAEYRRVIATEGGA